MKKAERIIYNQKKAAFQEKLRLNETSLMTRSNFLSSLIDPRRSIADECGYPAVIEPRQYRDLFNREGLAQRVVNLWPDECWKNTPSVYETEDGEEETEFEQAITALNKDMKIFSHLKKADEMSGVGRFGILFLGLPGDLSKPVFELDDEGKPKPKKMKSGKPARLLYLRVFDESSVTVGTLETDKQSPRYGRPLKYKIKLAHVDDGTVGIPSSFTELNVHWTRVIHIADNLQDSIIYGSPRLEPVFNRIHDYSKVMGGAGEMFWKGGFPGYSFEIDPDIDIEFTAEEKTLFREELAKWENGLQRTLILNGMSAKSLAPQVADPSPHVAAILEAIAIALKIPLRILKGSERGELASSQDSQTWNGRVSERRENYLTPYLVREFIDRMMAVGVLPAVEEYFVDWPDLNTASDSEKAAVALTRTQALAAYVSGAVETLIPPKEYLNHILEMEPDVVRDILKAEDEYQVELDDAKLHDAEIESEAMKTKGTDPETQMKLKAKNAPPPGQGGFPTKNSKNGHLKVKMGRK